MSRYLLDKGIAGDFVNRRFPVYDRAKTKAADGHQVGICTPVLGELWHGVEFSASRQKNFRHLRKMLVDLVVWPFDNDAAMRYGFIAATLQRSGRLIQQIDMQIAAIALTLGRCVVVTRDSDFSAVPDLKIEDWTI